MVSASSRDARSSRARRLSAPPSSRVSRVSAEHRFESGARHSLDERERREECAGLAALRRGHQRLERFAEHLGVDRGFAPRRRLFARREPVLAEEIVDQSAVCVVRERDAAMALLDDGFARTIRRSGMEFGRRRARRRATPEGVLSVPKKSGRNTRS